MAASGQTRFEGEGTADCSQNPAARGSSSRLSAGIASKLSKTFKGSGSEIKQRVPARSNQFVWKVQLLSYSRVRIWWLLWVLLEISCGKSWYLVKAIVAYVSPLMVGSKIYPTGNWKRFIAVLTIIGRVQAQSIPHSRSCTDSKSKYNYR